MRPWEIALIVANLLALGTLVIPQLQAVGWLGYVALASALIAGLQLYVEGYRWPMAPAYVLTIVFFSLWLLGILWPRGLQVTRFVAGVSFGLGLFTLLLATALPNLFPIFRLPRPSGPFPIGTVTFHWVDQGRQEIFSTDPQARRELMVQIWYPAKETSSSARAPYVTDPRPLSAALARLRDFPGFIFDYWNEVPTHAISSAPLASAKRQYPVLIFLTGLDGFRQSNTFQAEELASHGYIVVGIDQPYAAAVVSFPDGRQVTGWTKAAILPFLDQSLSPSVEVPTLNSHALPRGILPYFAQDVSFALDQLTALNSRDPGGTFAGRFDLRMTGAFGISLGAMVASEACHADARLKSCLMMDAAMPADVVRAGLRQPSMWITRDVETILLERQRSGGWTDAEITQTLSTMRAVFLESRPGEGYYVLIPGMFHINFTDAPYWSPLMSWLGLIGPIDPQRGFAIVNAYTLAFFDRTLGGLPSPLLDGPLKPYPEVRLELR